MSTGRIEKTVRSYVRSKTVYEVVVHKDETSHVDGNNAPYSHSEEVVAICDNFEHAEAVVQSVIRKERFGNEGAAKEQLRQAENKPMRAGQISPSNTAGQNYDPSLQNR